MTDFTKEELENISDELEGTVYYVLRKKIQSMIDNYCEHKWAFYLSSNGSSVKSQKCNKEL